MSELLDRLQSATHGLLWTSEADYPLEVFEWDGALALTSDALLEHLDLPPETVVECVEFDRFFEKAMRDRDWYDDAERARAQQFRGLVDVLHQTLSDMQVFRIGRTEIDAYVVGRSPDGTWAGLHTRIVET